MWDDEIGFTDQWKKRLAMKLDSPINGKNDEIGFTLVNSTGDKLLDAANEPIPIEEVYECLRCSKDGISSEDAEKRLEIFRYNKVEEKKEPFAF
ncbi:hypothetical protein L2E82_19098 [Cichorium intybus]|uniref:Uncharacterized protein n=1 Tax=Cichorium intybus TaxID=13427 RepID=A0ACB9FAT4_CICIN|nr:hypothetical protein L2E82_19098 [Cichorium intybus]